MNFCLVVTSSKKTFIELLYCWISNLTLFSCAASWSLVVLLLLVVEQLKKIVGDAGTIGGVSF